MTAWWPLRPRRQKKGLLGTKQVESYTLTLKALERIDNPVDQDAVALYFGANPANGDTIAFDQALLVDDGDEGTSALDDFKATVAAQLEVRNLTSSVPPAYEMGMLARGVRARPCIPPVLAAHGAYLRVRVPGIGCHARQLGDRGGADEAFAEPEAVELRERCRALKRWLEDFTNLGEAVPGDVVLWNKLLVMAVAFGVSDEVLRELADAVPRDVRGDDVTGYIYRCIGGAIRTGAWGRPPAALTTRTERRSRRSPRAPIARVPALAAASPAAGAAARAAAGAAPLAGRCGLMPRARPCSRHIPAGAAGGFPAPLQFEPSVRAALSPSRHYDWAVPMVADRPPRMAVCPCPAEGPGGVATGAGRRAGND